MHISDIDAPLAARAMLRASHSDPIGGPAYDDFPAAYVFDRLGLEIIVLDRNAKILCCSEPARRSLHASKQMAVAAEGHVMFLNGAIARKFRDFLTGAPTRPSSCEELTLVLNGEDGEPRRIVAIAVLHNPQDRDSPIFLLSIRELFKAADTWRMRQLMRFFGLTQAEEKLAAHLACGGRLNDAARMFSLSRHTVRNQLRSIFEKVGVHRQADLTLLMRGYA